MQQLKSTASLALIGSYGTKGTSATGAFSIAMGRDVTASAESAIANSVKMPFLIRKNAVAIGSGADTSYCCDCTIFYEYSW